MFASNLNKAKNGRFVSTTPWLYTAEHRRQRFKARVSTRSAKSTLIINSSKLRKITHQNSIRGNLNLPYKPLESILSRADLEKALHADIIIHHYYPSPLHHNHHQHPHHYHYHNHQRQLQQKQKHHHHQYHLKYHHINIFTIITITIIIIIITKPFSSSSSSSSSSSLLQLFGTKTCWKRGGVYVRFGGTPLLFYFTQLPTGHLTITCARGTALLKRG